MKENVIETKKQQVNNFKRIKINEVRKTHAKLGHDLLNRKDTESVIFKEQSIK